MRCAGALLAACLAACSGCRRAGPEERFDAVDDRAPAPARIVSLVPSATEVLFALGAGDRVVAVSAFDDFPPEVASRPRIGGMLRLSYEGLTALRPDAVVGVQGPTDLAVLRRLRAAGVRVVMPRVESVAELDASIDLFGRLVHRPAEAAALRARIAADLAVVRSRAATHPRVRVAAVFSRRPITAAGPGSWVDEVLAVAGGDNVVRAGGRYPALSAEALASLRPAVILDFAWMGEAADAGEGLDLPGAAGARVLRFADPVFLRPGPRVAEAARRIADALAPAP